MRVREIENRKIEINTDLRILILVLVLLIIKRFLFVTKPLSDKPFHLITLKIKDILKYFKGALLQIKLIGPFTYMIVLYNFRLNVTWRPVIFIVTTTQLH